MFSWRIHSGLLPGREEEVRSLIDTMGDLLQCVSGPARGLPLPLTESGSGPGLALTVIQDAKQLPQQGWVAPKLIYFDPHKYDVKHWLPRLAKHVPVLNDESLFVPMGLLSTTLTRLNALNRFDRDHQWFVRPDSGLKTFSGLSLTEYQLSENFYHQLAPLQPEVMVSISPHKTISPKEWRFWIVNREVVASSPYSWDDDLISGWEAAPIEAWQLAQLVASLTWQVDIAYVVDVVYDLDRNQFCVNELNAASTSGLYFANLPVLFNAFKAAVIDELDGLISVED